MIMKCTGIEVISNFGTLDSAPDTFVSVYLDYS